MNNVSLAVQKTQSRSVLVDMSARYGMEPSAFEETLRATVVPKDCSKEQFAAFLLVAKEYGLNPITKEIYAFPMRGGGIQPIVGIDGWCNLINSHPSLDGIEFDDHLEDDGKVTSITCRIWRKDREKPVVVTEYLAECLRGTDPWKQYPRRMLRHKALIQCARYAFGFAGIVDPDEAERINSASHMRDVTPRDEPPAPPPIEAPAATVAPEPETDEPPPAPPETDLEIPAALRRAPPPAAKAKPSIPNPAENPDEFLKWVDKQLAVIVDPSALEIVWNDTIEPRMEGLFPPDAEECLALFRKHERRLGAD